MGLVSDVLNLISMVFKFAYGHRLAKKAKLNPPRNIRRMYMVTWYTINSRNMNV